jgi:hypothetical protein
MSFETSVVTQRRSIVSQKAGVNCQIVKEDPLCFTLQGLVGMFMEVKAHTVLSRMCL